MLKTTKPINLYTQNTNEKFMKNSSNSDHAQMLVKERIGELRSKGLTRQETLDWLSRRGYLKTETDRKIVEGEMGKITDSNAERWKYKERMGERIRRQSLIDRISSKMSYEGMRERESIIQKIKNKKSKYF